jgi:hypothetical protein
MIEKLLMQQVMKKGRTTSEFASMIVGGVFTMGVASGIIDLSPEQVELATTNVVEGAGVIKSVTQGSGGIIDGLMRIVALIVGGQLASNYIKSRGNAKSAQAMVAVKGAMKELETFKKKIKQEVDYEADDTEIDTPAV